MSAEANFIRQLEQVYMPVIQQMTSAPGQPGEAREMFNTLIQKAQAQSKAKGLADIDAKCLFYLAETNVDLHFPKGITAHVKAELEWKRSEGVREEDLHWWWDMPDLSRQFFFQMDFLWEGGTYVALKRQGMSDQEASRQLYLAQPVFIEFAAFSDEPRNADFLLPAELRDRVNRRTQREAAQDPSGTKWDACRGGFSSFNAFVRHEISEGRI